MARFQSTLPVWGATQAAVHLLLEQAISIHAPRVGSDQCFARYLVIFNGFQSTLPVWGATQTTLVASAPSAISIHAPRVGSDMLERWKEALGDISIHAPRVGSDLVPLGKLLLGRGFQSTLPVWGATLRGHPGGSDVQISIHAPRVGSDLCVYVLVETRQDFNPRSPCGERRPHPGHERRGAVYFNPRSPCGERPSQFRALGHRRTFQSTLPVWGATRVPNLPPLRGIISIHAPRVGSDWAWITTSRTVYDFNPRSPCGERLMTTRFFRMASKFQSTLPVWGATEYLIRTYTNEGISIHAPRVGSDPARCAVGRCKSISIHAPRVGSDTDPAYITYPSTTISIHAPRVGSD